MLSLYSKDIIILYHEGRTVLHAGGNLQPVDDEDGRHVRSPVLSALWRWAAVLVMNLSSMISIWVKPKTLTTSQIKMINKRWLPSSQILVYITLFIFLISLKQRLLVGGFVCVRSACWGSNTSNRLNHLKLLSVSDQPQKELMLINILVHQNSSKTILAATVNVEMLKKSSI